MQLDIPPGSFGAYIFDLDGTLADTMPLHYQAWKRELAEHGCPFPEALFYELGGVPAHSIVTKLNQKFSLSMDPDQVSASKENRYVEMLEVVQPIGPVRDFMLAQHGKAPLAVATGGLRHVASLTLKSLALTDYFQAVVCAEDYAHGKPAPDVFLIAAERLGVAPADCLVFEDAGPGLEAAKAAGMQAVHVPSHPTMTESTEAKG